MRILFVNDGVGDEGGVQTYLSRVSAALRERGHDLAFLHVDSVRSAVDSPLPGATHFCVAEDGSDALARARAWHPTIVFSHNMHDLDVEEALFTMAPVVKMMHGYAGTCVSGQKMHRAPVAVPCARTLGVPCLALYAPRRCGMLSVSALIGGFTKARRQQHMFPRYAHMIVASAYMRDEYLRNGMRDDVVTVAPLFGRPLQPTRAVARGSHVLFLGRMTYLKGGDVLIRAVADASTRLGVAIPLTMAGDGPQRRDWQELATRLAVPATFTGWLSGSRLDDVIAEHAILAMPSVWPEPFGLSGLEAGSAGVPSIAFDVGGIHEWLRHGENGRLVPHGNDAIRSFADAIAGLHRDPEELRRLGAGARLAATRFTLERHVDQVENVLASLSTRGTSASVA